MENIIIDSKSCFFLNHHKLIQHLYRQHVKTNSTSYSLKQIIFNFKPKITPPGSEAKPNSKSLKSFNRKRKAEVENESIKKENLNLEPFFREIKNKCLITPHDNEDFSRVWEEQYDFPQFRGANPTNEFQTIKLSNHDFIIPPKTKFFNYNIEHIPKILPDLELYDLLIIDMPWRNKYIRRLKKVKKPLAYSMLDNETLSSMPIPQLIHKNSLVVIWCTNALQHRTAIEEKFLPNWNLQIVRCLKWYKINTLGELIGPLKPEGFKQPYELLYIACPKQRNLLELKHVTNMDFLISIPSIIHSHKPPLTELLKQIVPDSENFKGLEIFARYLQPQFTSIGLEVLKLMDKRLYNATHDG